MKNSSTTSASGGPIPDCGAPYSGVSCVFPCFNEASNIATAIETLRGALVLERDSGELIKDFEIIAVNDGSTDETRAEILRMSELYPEVQLANHDQNQGYGMALRSGFAKARFDLVFYADSDNQFDYTQIRELLRLTRTSDVVCGYRVDRQDSTIRILNALGWNVLVAALLGRFVRDLDCGFKLFKRNALERIMVTGLQGRGAIISAELLLRLKQQQQRFAEVPVRHYPRTAGAPTGANYRVIARAFRELATLMAAEASTRLRRMRAS